MMNSITHISYSVEHFNKHSFLRITSNAEITDNTTSSNGYNSACYTCNNKDPYCYGHFGQISMPGLRFYNIAFKKFFLMLNKKICYYCKILPLKATDYDSMKGFVYDKPAVLHCQHCGSTARFVFSAKNQDQGIVYECKEESVHRYINPLLLYQLCEALPDNFNKVLLGNYRFTDLFYIDKIPVIPLYLRYNVQYRTASKSTTKATTTTSKYTSILECYNNYLEDLHPTIEIDKKGRRKDVQRTIDPARRLVDIQIHLNDLIQPGTYDGTDQTKSITAPILTKNNIIRDTINGTRKPNTTRVVLGAIPSHKIDYCKVPHEVITMFNVPIVFNNYTAELIKAYYNNGLVKGYCKRNGRFVSYRQGIEGIMHLNKSDIVEISIYNKHPIIHVRQPSLLLSNVMATLIDMGLDPVDMFRPDRIQQTMAFTLAVMIACNGDQDGDEVTSTVSPTIMSMYEQIHIMLPTHNILSPAHGCSTYGILQEELMALNKILHISLPFREVLYLIGPYIDFLQAKYPERVAKQDKFLGSEIISACIDKHINKPNVLKNGALCMKEIKYKNFGGQSITSSVIKMLHSVLEPRILVNTLESTMLVAKRAINIIPTTLLTSELFKDLHLWEAIHAETIENINAVNSNYIRYLDDVASGKIPRMEMKREKTFLDVEIGKVMVKTRESIINTIIPHWQKNRPDSGMYLAMKTEYKMNPEILSNLFVCASSEIKPNTEYFGRACPVYKFGDPDFKNNGLVKSTLLHGLSVWCDQLYQVGPAHSHLISIVCTTAFKGDLSRYFRINLENNIINYTHRFLVMGPYILAPNLNAIKLPVDEMHLVHIDIEYIKSVPLLYARYIEFFDHIYSVRNNIVSNQLVYPVDIECFILSDQEKYRNEVNRKSTLEERVSYIDDFFRHIYYSYWLGFGDMKTLPFVTIYYAIKFNVTYNTLVRLFEKIEYKYCIYPQPGYAAGMIAATTIGEMETQSVLSSHHVQTKGGVSVKDTLINSNVKLYRINTKHCNKVQDNPTPTTILSYDYNALLHLRRCLEYIYLGMIKTKINVKKRLVRNPDGTRTAFVFTDIIVNPDAIHAKGINMFVVENMITNFIESRTYITSASMTIKGYHISFTVTLSSSSFYPIYLSSIEYGISKGLVSLYNYLLEPTTIRKVVDNEIVERSAWRLLAVITNLNCLSYFDTSNMMIQPPIESISHYFGIPSSHQCLFDMYTGEGLVKLHFSSVAKIQVRNGTGPLRLNKNHGDEMTTISKCSATTPQYELQKAAVANKTEYMDVMGKILTNQKVSFGTGYMSTFYDPFLNIPQEEYGDVDEL